MKTKISIRVPAELMTWVETEISRRSCDTTTVLVDALRLAATAGQIDQQQQQITALLGDLIPLMTQRFDRMENYTVQSLNFAGALAKQAGVVEQAKAGFQAWKQQKEQAHEK